MNGPRVSELSAVRKEAAKWKAQRILGTTKGIRGNLKQQEQLRVKIRMTRMGSYPRGLSAVRNCKAVAQALGKHREISAQPSDEAGDHL
jgi:hypothetical protein